MIEKINKIKDRNYILNGERVGCLGLVVGGLIAVLKYLFARDKLTVRDGRRLNDLNALTGINFPLK